MMHPVRGRHCVDDVRQEERQSSRVKPENKNAQEPKSRVNEIYADALALLTVLEIVCGDRLYHI
jgi:hypothetical protein